jgi:Glycerol-3-phosphate dehydrogenase
LANKKEFKIGVIGAGAWGTALANILAQKQHVRLWAKEKTVCENIEKQGENKRFLPKIKLNKKINCTTEINNVSECKILFFGDPSSISLWRSH